MNQDYARQRTISADVKIRSLVQEMTFGCVGTVSGVNTKGTRVDVSLPYLDANLQPIILKGIEVVRPGTHALRVVYTPTIGDVVLVFSMQDYWAEVKHNNLPTKRDVYFEPYSTVTMKAIPIQTNEDNAKATIIEVKEDSLNISTPLKVNITCDKQTTVTCKDKADVTIEKQTTVICKDKADVTIEKEATVTCKDKTTVNCKKDVTLDASNQNIVVKSSKTTINSHLEIT